MQLSTVQCSAVQCSAVKSSAVQCSAVKCSAIQSNAVQKEEISVEISPQGDQDYLGNGAKYGIKEELICQDSDQQIVGSI